MQRLVQSGGKRLLDQVVEGGLNRVPLPVCPRPRLEEGPKPPPELLSVARRLATDLSHRHVGSIEIIGVFVISKRASKQWRLLVAAHNV